MYIHTNLNPYPSGMKTLNPPKRTVPIVFAFDENMEIPAGVSITSLLLNASSDTFYDIFILHPMRCNFSSSKISILPAIYHNCQIHFLAIDDTFAEAFEIRGISVVTYYRLIIPELIPEYDKVLFSDVDVIFREDLSKYYEVDLSGYYFAGVNAYPSFPEDIRNYIRNTMGRDTSEYFYAGNLVIHSKYLMDDGMVAHFKQKAQTGQYKFQDMDIINQLCRGKIKALPAAYCMTTYLYDALLHSGEMLTDEETYTLDRGIVHYNGAKPWKTSCLNMDIWWEYYRKSIFFDEKFCHEFWTVQSQNLERLPLWKRVKILFRYPLDRKNCR